MASAQNMKGMDTKKYHSAWWNSHSTARNSKWLSENFRETDRLFREIMELIEEDGDSFAKKAQMYYQRRPELVSRVVDFYRLYRALLERYDNVTGELAKNIPTELHSQGSMNESEFMTHAISLFVPSSPELTSEHRPHLRSAGSEAFLGLVESSDLSRKESYESSECGSDRENCKVILDDFENSYKLEERITELGNELHAARDKLQKYKNGAKEQSERLDFSSNFSMEKQHGYANRILTELVKQIEELQENLPDHGEEIDNLKEAMGAAAKQFETEISCREYTIKEFKKWIGSLLNKFVTDNSSPETEFQSINAEEKDEDEQMSEQKPNPEIETRHKDSMIVQSSSMLLQEKHELEAKISSLMVSNSSKDSELQLFEGMVKQLEAEKSKLCTESEKQISGLNQNLVEYKMKVDILKMERDELCEQVIKLIEDTECWDDESRKIDEQLHELHMEHAKLIQEAENARKASVELTNRVKELEDVVESQRGAIVDCADGKKEAIRQLCLSLEHYRIGYQELRQILQVRFKRNKLIAM
ncbi:hypothetical protein KSP39_PZI021647 [Platanthera zijinensis]|uniref:NAB domain-containing protein n=1 Tax=Platanthera zijinensis TaxID=2320716 RepID=A0AAP0AXR5_9ASPA